MTSLFSLIIGFGALFLLIRTILKYRKGFFDSGETVFWSLVWFTLLTLSIYPGLSNYFAKLLGIDRGVDLVVYISIVVLFFMNFHFYTKIMKQDQDLTKLVRKISKKK